MVRKARQRGLEIPVIPAEVLAKAKLASRRRLKGWTAQPTQTRAFMEISRLGDVVLERRVAAGRGNPKGFQSRSRHRGPKRVLPPYDELQLVKLYKHLLCFFRARKARFGTSRETHVERELLATVKEQVTSHLGHARLARLLMPPQQHQRAVEPAVAEVLAQRLREWLEGLPGRVTPSVWAEDVIAALCRPKLSESRVHDLIEQYRRHFRRDMGKKGD